MDLLIISSGWRWITMDQLDNQLIRVRMGGFNEEGTALKGVLV